MLGLHYKEKIRRKPTWISTTINRIRRSGWKTVTQSRANIRGGEIHHRLISHIAKLNTSILLLLLQQIKDKDYIHALRSHKLCITVCLGFFPKSKVIFRSGRPVCTTPWAADHSRLKRFADRPFRDLGALYFSLFFWPQSKNENASQRCHLNCSESNLNTHTFLHLIVIWITMCSRTVSYSGYSLVPMANTERWKSPGGGTRLSWLGRCYLHLAHITLNQVQWRGTGCCGFLSPGQN